MVAASDRMSPNTGDDDVKFLGRTHQLHRRIVDIHVFQRVILPVADGAEQDRIGLLGQLQSSFRQRMAVRHITSAADRRGFHFESLVQHIEHAHGLFDDFGTDAIAGSYSYVQDESFRLSSLWQTNLPATGRKQNGSFGAFS